MSVDVAPRSPDNLAEDYSQYRALSVLAVTSCVLGVLSAATFLSWSLVAIPLLGLATGLAALVRIRGNQQELAGTKFAVIGMLLSGLFFFAGSSYLTYDYLAELPPGYQRLSYAELQPDPDVPGQIYPPDIEQKSGERIFIKGYVYPGKQTSGIKQFVLCRDNGDCCFGGQPRLTDRILVTLNGPSALEYSTRLRHVAGTFRVEPARATDGLGGVIYNLDADYLK